MASESLLHYFGMCTFAAMDFTEIIRIGSFTTTYLELIAVLFGLLSVWHMKKESILAFPLGIVNVLIYIYICFITRLYAVAAINFFFFLMSVYGWYYWTRKDFNNKHVIITQCSSTGNVVNVTAILIFFFILRYILTRYTDSIVPTWDALTTAIYIIAQWLMSRKKIENWLFWITGDVISVGLFASQGLYFSSLQYLVFTIIATLGFLEWRIKLIK
jgi:nicotinamide mononucleotide transporter